MDSEIAPSIENGLYLFSSALSTVAIIVAVLPWFVVPLLPVVAIFVLVQQHYRCVTPVCFVDRSLPATRVRAR